MIRIDVLPDDVLLDIFDFYVEMSQFYGYKWITERWQSLVHVCRRWRRLVLGSPRRLNLRLFCTHRTPARDTLDVWPAFPLIVAGDHMDSSSGTDNLIAAIGQSNRVCRVDLSFTVGWKSEEVLAAMHVPFPEMKYLRLISYDETLSVIPDSFLDGSAPHLRHIELMGIPFPGLPKLLLSAIHLVDLWLTGIPHSGYISPETIVALLSVLSSLERFSLEFQSPQSRPDREIRRPPPSKRSVIPTLISLHFRGVTEYLEDLVTFIDTPRLDNMHILLFNQIDFDIPRLAQFINRIPEHPERVARVQFDDYSAHFLLHSRSGMLQLTIRCKEPDWQLSSIEQVCNSCLHPLSTVEDLYIDHRYSELVWNNDAIENTLWLQLLLPFTAVKHLYLFKEFAPGIAAALQELIAGRITQVLPSLRNIFVEELEPSGLGPIQENIGQLVAARQLSDHPIAVSNWVGRAAPSANSYPVELLTSAPSADDSGNSADSLTPAPSADTYSADLIKSAPSANT
jgi:hypothetical protein